MENASGKEATDKSNVAGKFVASKLKLTLRNNHEELCTLLGRKVHLRNHIFQIKKELGSCDHFPMRYDPKRICKKV